MGTNVRTDAGTRPVARPQMNSMRTFVTGTPAKPQRASFVPSTNLASILAAQPTISTMSRLQHGRAATKCSVRHGRAYRADCERRPHDDVYKRHRGGSRLRNLRNLAKTTAAGSGGTVTWILFHFLSAEQYDIQHQPRDPESLVGKWIFVASVPTSVTIQYNTTVSGASGSPQYSLDFTDALIKWSQ